MYRERTVTIDGRGADLLLEALAATTPASEMRVLLRAQYDRGERDFDRAWRWAAMRIPRTRERVEWGKLLDRYARERFRESWDALVDLERPVVAA